MPVAAPPSPLWQSHMCPVTHMSRQWISCSSGQAALTSPASSLAAPVFLSALLLIPTPSHLPVSTKGQLFQRLGLGSFPSSESPPQPPFSPQAINTSTRGACHIYASVGKVQLCRNLQLASSYSPGTIQPRAVSAVLTCRGGSVPRGFRSGFLPASLWV